MKVNFNKNFRDFRGNELPDESISQTIAEALFNHGTGMPASESDKKMASSNGCAAKNLQPEDMGRFMN